jgi:hypothetical protein
VTSQRDLESTLDRFFELGADEVADRVIDDALQSIAHTPQRRARLVPWRFLDMSSTWRLATIAVAVVLAVGGAAWIIGRVAGPSVGSGPSPVASATPSATLAPSPSPSPSANPTPTATPPSTTGWLPFTSSHYGYQIAYPPTWVATQATRSWATTTDPLAAAAPGGDLDVFLGGPNGDQTAVLGFAADFPAGTSEDAWLTSYYAGRNYCATMPTFEPITVDGHPGRLDPCYDAQAFVFVGNRVYVFVIYRTQMQPLFRAFLSTVKLPSSPPSGSPAASASPGPS